MKILSITAVFTLLALNAQTIKLACVKTGKTESTIVVYQTVSGQKGARGLKGSKGEPGGITKQRLDALESKEF